MNIQPLLLKRFVIATACTSLFGSVLSAQTSGKAQFEYRGNLRVNTRTNVAAAMYNINSQVYQGSPEEMAQQFLNENKTIFGIVNVADLKLLKTIESPAGKHVGFMQTYHGIPVFRSEIVVSMNRANRITMVVNGNEPMAGVGSTAPNITKEIAISEALGKVNADEKTLIMQPTAELYLYRDSVEQLSLAWKVNLVANVPIGDWQVFVDAITGTILSVSDISAQYVSGLGRVFRPDPITALRDSTLTDQNDSDYPGLQTAYQTVTLPNLNDPIGGIYRVQGKYARSEDIEYPFTPPVESSTSSFLYNRSQLGFEEVNAYYFIDGQRQYVGQLGFAPTWNGNDYICFDANGYDGSDGAHYDPTPKILSFGDGFGIDDAEDQDIILHEYTHALHDALMQGGYGSTGYDEKAISEGSGDYMALSYRRTLSNFRQDHVFNWDGNGESWSGRSLAASSRYPGQWTGNIHDPAGVVWSSTMMDIQNATNRDITTTLLLTSFSYVSPELLSIVV
jgi:hypothetical protein